MTRPYPKPGKRKPSRGARSRAQVEQVRPEVYERDEHTCVVQGSRQWQTWPCSRDLTIQHAVGRGMGGSVELDSPALLRTMCGFHNLLETSDADFARACTVNGWSIPRNRADIDPLQVPVRYPDGGDYLLDDDGGRRRIPRADAQAFRLETFGQAVA